MELSNLNTLISAFRLETEKNSISPDTVGHLLQMIVDFSNENNVAIGETISALSSNLLAEVASLESKIDEQESAIADLQHENDAQDELLEQANTTAETALATAQSNSSNMSKVQRDIDSLEEQTYALQQAAVKNRQDLDGKDIEHDSIIAAIQETVSALVSGMENGARQMENFRQLVESANENAELALSQAQTNKSLISTIQTSVSGNASDIFALQETTKTINQEIVDLHHKTLQQDIAINNNNSFILSVEQNCNNRQDVYDTQFAALTQRVVALENNNSKTS